MKKTLKEIDQEAELVRAMCSVACAALQMHALASGREVDQFLVDLMEILPTEEAELADQALVRLRDLRTHMHALREALRLKADISA